MKTYAKFASLLLLAVLVFLPMQSASAKGLFEGRIIFGQSFTLNSGETIDGDLVVIGGSAAVEEGAQVTGDLVVVGGGLVLNGTANRDAVVIGGTAELGATAHVFGDLSTVGASLERAQGSQVDGQIFTTATSWVGSTDGNQPLPHVVIPSIPMRPDLSFAFDPFRSLAGILGQAVAFGILAMLVTLFLAPQAERVGHAITARPLAAGGIGLLTLVLAPAALILLSITLILIPVALLLVSALVVAGVFGWIAIGLEIGQRFTRAIHQEWHPSLAAGPGTFALTLIAYTVSSLPVVSCAGWLVPFLLGLAAMGGVILSRFGTLSVAAPLPAAAAPIVPAVQTPEAPALKPVSPPQRKPRTKK